MQILRKNIKEVLFVSEKLYDVVIAGGGVAGLCAGLYAARAGLHTVILEQGVVGGQATITDDIRNYPGFSEISGTKLAENLLKQAESFGAELVNCKLLETKLSELIKVCITDKGVFGAKTVICASGARPRKAGFEGETEYAGRGVSRCAVCDGFFWRGKDVFVIGGGESAAKESIYLSRICRSVKCLVRADSFKCAEDLKKRLEERENIEVLYNTEMRKVSGYDSIKTVLCENTKDKKFTEYTVNSTEGAFGVFVFVGFEPNSDIFRNELTLDAHGYIVTDENMQTNVPGVFAAGDVRKKPLHQLITAASDGAVASIQAYEYIESRKNALDKAGEISSADVVSQNIS